MVRTKQLSMNKGSNCVLVPSRKQIAFLSDNSFDAAQLGRDVPDAAWKLLDSNMLFPAPGKRTIKAYLRKRPCDKVALYLSKEIARGLGNFVCPELAFKARVPNQDLEQMCHVCHGRTEHWQVKMPPVRDSFSFSKCVECGCCTGITLVRVKVTDLPEEDACEDKVSKEKTTKNSTVQKNQVAKCGRNLKKLKTLAKRTPVAEIAKRDENKMAKRKATKRTRAQKNQVVKRGLNLKKCKACAKRTTAAKIAKRNDTSDHRRKYISKAKSEKAKRQFAGGPLDRWLRACKKARGQLGITGFAAPKTGSRYHDVAKAYYDTVI